MRLIYLIGALISYNLCQGARILVLTPMGPKSHKNTFMAFSEGLAERGHNVTIVSAHNNSKSVPNIRDYAVTNGTPASAIMENLDNIFDQEDNNKFLIKILSEIVTICNDFLALDQIQALKKEKFDLVILSLFVTDCFASFLHHFEVPYILASPAGLIGPLYDLSGQIYLPSIAGLETLATGSFPYGFIDRFKATLITDILYAVYKYIILPKQVSTCRERGLCAPDMPPIYDLYRNASLVIVNSVRALEIPPRPYFPNVVFMGGGNCRNGKPLPTDIEEWIQEAGEDGFIFFSLGSTVIPSKLPERMRKILVKVFGSLKQRVLWKWDTTMDDVPPNVRLGKWFPQQDILAHPKLKLFITHGGLLSTLETTFHGKPILGLPVFADQYANLNKAEQEGWAMKLLWKDLTEESFKSKIESAMHNEEMKTIVEHRSALMKDFPRSPIDEAVYWIEYVLRHNGAKNLRSPIHDYSKFYLYNIDVRLTCIGIAVILLGGIVFLVLKLLKCCLRLKSSKEKTKKE